MIHAFVYNDIHHLTEAKMNKENLEGINFYLCLICKYNKIDILYNIHIIIAPDFNKKNVYTLFMQKEKSRFLLFSQY